MRKSEKATAPQKSAVTTNSVSRSATSTGDTSKSFCAKSIASPCQSKMAKAAAATLVRAPLSLEVEAVVGELSAD
jgi:hypothetical protein